MDAQCAGSLLHLLGAYASVGIAFAFPFLGWGVQRIDPGARGAGCGFRVVIFSGVVIFWPWLAWRWLRGHREPPQPRDAHRRNATGSGS